MSDSVFSDMPVTEITHGTEATTGTNEAAAGASPFNAVTIIHINNVQTQIIPAVNQLLDVSGHPVPGGVYRQEVQTVLIRIMDLAPAAPVRPGVVTKLPGMVEAVAGQS